MSSINSDLKVIRLLPEKHLLHSHCQKPKVINMYQDYGPVVAVDSSSVVTATLLKRAKVTSSTLPTEVAATKKKDFSMNNARGGGGGGTGIIDGKKVMDYGPKMVKTATTTTTTTTVPAAVKLTEIVTETDLNCLKKKGNGQAAGTATMATTTTTTTTAANSINDPDPIVQFYENQHILITGGTGFVGKVLIEKLLRTCPNLGAIYLLVREKRGMSSDLRVKELLKNQIFDRVREINPKLFEKVHVIGGDVTLPDLGLSKHNMTTLIENVTIVLHSAADVRFNESLQDSVQLNTLGTKRIIDLCLQLHRLQSFVHVSTAYSNSDKLDATCIDESVYPSTYDPYMIMKCSELLPPAIFNSLAAQFLGNHPNTYTFTKSLAETLVLDSSAQLPATTIVRPSIVTAAWKDPIAGWVDNISGITGIMMEIGRGTISSIICKKQLTMDLIPVDIVANTILASAWFSTVERSNTVRVFNCTSGHVNPISWQDFGHLTTKYAIQYPTKYLALYPGFQYRTNRVAHFVCHLCFHFLPAVFYDFVLYCSKRRPLMVRICQKFAEAAKNGTFFAINEWQFGNEQMQTLIRAVENVNAFKTFHCDLSPNAGFHWDTYVKHYMLGIRRYVLKDDISSLADAKSKLRKCFFVRDQWFMQNGARPHRTKEVFDLLNTRFQDQIIGLDYPEKHGDGLTWPPCDFYLWGYLKDKVYKKAPKTLDDPKKLIREAAAAINQPTMKKVYRQFCKTV